MVYLAATPPKKRAKAGGPSLSDANAKLLPELGELLCRFLVNTGRRGLTNLAVVGFCFTTESEQSGFPSSPVHSFALHSQSAQPIEIRWRFSFLLPPLFAPGRCAASLFMAVVMSLQGVTTAFVFVGVAERVGV